MIEEKNIPNHWELKKLGEVCLTTSGGTPNRGNSKFYQGNIPWVKSGELDRGLILDTEEKISEEAIKNSSAKVFPRGTLLIALYGATIGKLAFLGVDAATNQAICGIFKNDKIDSSYLYHFLFYKKPNLVKQGIGGAQPNISQGILKNLDLPIPPLHEQQAIVAKIEELLSELDNGKQQLLTAQQQLKVYRQSLLKWAFEGKLTNKDVKEGELPVGWKSVVINDIGKIKGGKRLPPKHHYSDEPTDYAYIMAGNLKDGTVKNRTTFIKEETYNALANYKVTGGEVYITIVGACIGDAGVIPENIGNSILTENASKIIELKGVLNKYLSRWINSHNCQLQIKRKILSATLGKLALNRIGTIEVPLPSIAEQAIIVDELESKLTVCDKVEETISQSLLQVETLRQSILMKAFEGKLISPEANVTNN